MKFEFFTPWYEYHRPSLEQFERPNLQDALLFIAAEAEREPHLIKAAVPILDRPAEKYGQSWFIADGNNHIIGYLYTIDKAE